ncbi:histidine phosphatase family protein [Bacillus sp. AK128]
MVRTVAITLLRHGITEENQQKRYIGWTDVPLSTEGRSHLTRMQYPEPDYIISSDLKRCMQTVEEIYGSNLNVPVTYSSKWRELSFGDWERKNHLELNGNPLYEKWLNEWEVAQIPNGESYPTFRNRVMNGWLEAKKLLVDFNYSELVIISHGGPIRLFLSEMAPNRKPFWDWKVDNGSGYRLVTTEERLRRNERCISLQEVPFKESEDGFKN